MKKVIRLTESDLVRIVRRVIKEGVTIEQESTPWNQIKDIMKGNAMKSNADGSELTLYREPGDALVGSSGVYNEFSIIQNPRQVQLNQVGKMEVVSFDPMRKTVTFQNGVVIGPA